MPLSLLVLLAAGCAAGIVTVGAGPAAVTTTVGDADCTALFQRYDIIEATMSTPSGQADNMPIPPVLQPAVAAIVSAGCLTFSDELVLPETATRVADSGAAIAPTRVHAGIVTNMEDDAAARAFFEAQGVPARSIGAAGLGRRIYIGPFATDGALTAALALSRKAGFSAPYPANF